MGKKLPKAIGSTLNALAHLSPGLSGKYAFRLFCTPRTGRLQPADHAFLASSEKHSVLSYVYGTIKTYVWNQQGKQSVLLLHGWESNAARWQRLIGALLAADFRVLAFDAPAHGASSGSLFDVPRYAEALARTLERFPVDHIVAHSVGGACLCYYLSHFPMPPIDRLCLLGVPAELHSMVDNYVNIIGLSDKALRSLDDHMFHTIGRRIDYFSFVNFSQKIKNKTLIIHDHGDQVIAVKDGKAFQQNIANARLVLTNDLGHSLQDQSVYDEILSFLGEG